MTSHAGCVVADEFRLVITFTSKTILSTNMKQGFVHLHQSHGFAPHIKTVTFICYCKTSVSATLDYSRLAKCRHFKSDSVCE